MMMSEDPLKVEIGTLERKVRLLLTEHDKVKQQLDDFRKENEELQSRIKSQQEQLVNFQNSHKITKIVDSMTASGGDSRELKEVLNSYIKEIDKCIAHLSEA